MSRKKGFKQKRIGRTVAVHGFTPHRDVKALVRPGMKSVVPTVNGEPSSFKLTGQQMLNRYADSPTFRAICDSGKYVYVDHSLVLRSSECIEMVGGQLRIKASVLNNQSAYLYHQVSGLTIYGHRPMYSKPGKPRVWRGHGFYKKHIGIPGRGTSVTQDQNADLFASLTTDDWSIIIGSQDNLPGSFPDALRHLMSEKHCTEEELAETSNFSTRTIQRLRNGTSRPKIETVVALCVGLSLDNYTGHRLVNIAGLSFTSSPKDRTLEFIVGVAFDVNIFQVNEFLQKRGFKPLN